MSERRIRLSLGIPLLLMTTSGLLMVAASFLFGVQPGRVQILLGYAAYLLPAVFLLFSERRKQLYLTRIDSIALLFMALVLAGLVIRVVLEGQPEAVRNGFYFVLFVGMPFLIGRAVDPDAIAQYGRAILALLVLILVLMALPGAVRMSDASVRPVVFSTEYSTISLSFALGVGILVTMWKGATANARSRTLVYAAMLIVFMSASAYLVLRGSYYLALACTGAMLFALRQRTGSPIMLAAFAFGIVAGGALSQDSISYHQKLMHPSVEQLPLDLVYLDFFSPDAWNITPGRSVLEHVNCLPMVASDDSAVIRVLLYLEAIKLFVSSPFVGVGVSNFSDYSCFSPHGFPHSTVLHVAAEMGIVGLGLFLTVLFKTVVVIYRATAASLLPDWVFFVFVFYFCLDQIYGSYFFASITYFMIGLASRLLFVEERTKKIR